MAAPAAKTNAKRNILITVPHIPLKVLDMYSLQLVRVLRAPKCANTKAI